MKHDFYDEEDQAEELAEQIIRCYEKHNVLIRIRKKDVEILQDRVKFKIKLRAGTRVADIQKYEKDIQIFLKLQLFQVVQDNLNIYIVASKKMLTDCSWHQVWKCERNTEKINKMNVSHFIGVDAMGDAVVNDLALYPHVLIAGTTGSGKSVAIKNLLAYIAYKYSPAKVNILIGDLAGDLLQFRNMPHLSYPIIQDLDEFHYAMFHLKEEMERRIRLKESAEYHQIPRIICVIDEFTSFISGTDAKSKTVRGIIVEMLRRGRHAKIHMVLVAHNPTKQRLKMDLSDIPTKMVFRVARLSNSVAILGEGGAEKLKGNGDMLLQTSQSDRLQRIQGAFISCNDINQIVQIINVRWRTKKYNTRFKFHIQKSENESVVECTEIFENKVLTQAQVAEGELLARIIFWGIKQDSISCNMLMKKFGLGWNRADHIIEKMHEVGLVGELDAKLPRKILVNTISDVPEEVLQLLLNNGFSREMVAGVLDCSKKQLRSI